MKNFENLSKVDKTLFYFHHARPTINRQALFADGTEFYRSYVPAEDGYCVCLRFRTEKENVDSVTLVTDTMRQAMELENTDCRFDYYRIELKYPSCGQEYYFEIVSGKMRLIYNKRGVMDEAQAFYNFKFRPNFKTPDWAKGAVFYQIYVDRFCNGDARNDVMDREYSYLNTHVCAEKDWFADIHKQDVGHFYGGDLQGVWDKLDYLQELGVEVLYLNPIFVSPSNHKYDSQDYDYVDPHFTEIPHDVGNVLNEEDMDNRHAERYICRVTDKENLEASNTFFVRFVEEVHRRGMKIILDGVFNHCGSFNKWLDKEEIYSGRSGYEVGAYVSDKSPYRKYFNFLSDTWPKNTDYDGWWGYKTLPKLHYEASQELYQNIINIGKKWVSPPYNADGWRLDVGADLGYSKALNHQFWQDFRRGVKEANPNALILAEHYEDPAAWLDGDEWDTVMNYEAFMEPITWFLTGMEKHSDVYREDLLGNFECFERAMSHHMSRFHHESLYVAMNELSNHDHSRFLTRTNGQVGRLAERGALAASEGIQPAVMREAVIMQMTWPGSPTIYYGDEAGVCGWTDPDNRRTYPWGREDKTMLDFHREVIRIHRESQTLRTGSFKLIYGENGILAYGRFDREECYAVILNNTDESRKISAPVWQLGTQEGTCMERLMMSDTDGFTCEKAIYVVKNGCIVVEMPKKSGMILRGM